MANGKRIAKNTIYLYLRMFLVMLVSLYTVRVVINTLGVVDYGIFTAVGGIVLMMSFISQTITVAAQRYFSFELGKNNMQRLREIFSTVFYIYFLAAIVIALIAEIVGIWFLENKLVIPFDRLEAAHWVLHFSLLSFIIHILYTPFNAMIIAHENMKVYAYFSIIEVLLKLGIVYLLLLTNKDKLSFYAFLLFCASLVIASIYCLYCYFHYKETHIMLKSNRKMYSELVTYSSWTMFGTLAGVANQQGSSLLLNVFFGPVANASQSVANQVSHALQLFGSNLFAAIRPPMTKLYAQGKYEDVLTLFYKSSKLSFFLLYVILLPLFAETHYVLQLWLKNISDYMVDFTRLMLIYVVVLALSNPITIIMHAARSVKKYHGIIDGFTLCTLLFSYFFLLAGFRASVVFYIMIGVVFVAHIFRLILLNEIISFSYKKYFSEFIRPSFIVVLGSLLFVLFVEKFIEIGVERFIVVLVASIVINGFLIISIGLNSEERKTIIKILNRHLKFV